MINPSDIEDFAKASCAICKKDPYSPSYCPFSDRPCNSMLYHAEEMLKKGWGKVEVIKKQTAELIILEIKAMQGVGSLNTTLKSIADEYGLEGIEW